MSIENETPAVTATDAPASGPVRVLFVDDNVLAAQALQRFMSGRSEISLAAWAVNGEEALSLVVSESPHVVLLDLDMPGVDTMALVGQLEEASPGVRIVIFSGHCRADEIERALGAGAAGYVCKDEPISVTVNIVVRAAHGQCVLSPMVERAFLSGQ